MPNRAGKRPAEVIDLNFSVDIDGTQIKQLTMRRPTVRDQLGFEEGKGSEARRVVNMLAHLCEVSSDTILDLDQSDFNTLAEVLQGFNSPQQETSDEPA